MAGNAPSQANKTLPLFASIDDYNPSTDWLDGASPRHPYFDNPSRLSAIISEIKSRVATHLLTGASKLLSLLPQDETTTALQHLLTTNPTLWLALLSTQKFGVIYWLSRSEARRYLPLVRSHLPAAALIDAFLTANQNLNSARLFRYAVRAIVQDGHGHGHGDGDGNGEGKWLTVTHHTRFIPPHAISCLGNHVVAVRAREWTTPAEASLVLDDEDVAYDLHDFAHLAAAMLSPELFGSRYFRGDLGGLETSLTQLIASPGIGPGTGPKMSDGMMFSEILMGVFADAVGEHLHGAVRRDYASLEKHCAGMLAGYLVGGKAMMHVSTGREMEVEEAATPVQLAVLAQNKAYELPAAEVEQRVFTRGGPVGDPRDVLEGMSGVQRIEFLAESKSWLYFEVRQTIKHRAQKEGYRLVAERWLEEGVEVELAKKILENITYEDWKAGRRLDLWQVVREEMQN